jgi:putative DNA primase/helicase
MVILRENSTGEIVLGLDIQGEGGSIVVAPSLHAGGKRYRWRNAAQIADAPEWFLRQLRETQKSRANESAAIGATISEGRRNDTLTSLAGTMRRCGMGAEEIEDALLVTNNKRCDPPLDEDEVRKIASSVCRYKPAVEAAFR